MSKPRTDDARLMALRLLGAVLDDGAALADAPENTSADPRNRAYARQELPPYLQHLPLARKGF